MNFGEIWNELDDLFLQEAKECFRKNKNPKSNNDKDQNDNTVKNTKSTYVYN